DPNYPRAHGSWGLYPGVPGDLSPTRECYLALKLAGDSPDAPHLRKAREFVRERGGIARARTFTRIWLALFGEFPWSDLPAMPPELMLLPDRAPLSIYRFSSWARGTIVPLLILMNERPVRPVPRAARVAELWVEGAGPTPARDPIDGAFLALDRALRIYDRFPVHPLRRRALDTAESWILSHQEADGSWGGIQPPWVYSLMELSGWAFEFENDLYPDVDDTAVVLLALERAGAVDPALRKRAIRWMLAMQSANGGFAAFDKDNTSRLPALIPFADFGEMIDPPSADVTAHVLEALAAFGYQKRNPAVRRALAYLRDQQELEGSWFGRWGVNHLYGTGAVLPALAAL